MAFPKEKASAATLPIACTQQGAHIVSQVPPGSIRNAPSGSGRGSPTSAAAAKGPGDGGHRWQTGLQDPPAPPGTLGQGAESKTRGRGESLILLPEVEKKEKIPPPIFPHGHRTAEFPWMQPAGRGAPRPAPGPWWLPRERLLVMGCSEPDISPPSAFGATATPALTWHRHGRGRAREI